MNKQDALKRIEAIEAEAKELRKIVEGPEQEAEIQQGELVCYYDGDGSGGMAIGRFIGKVRDRYKCSNMSSGIGLVWDHARRLTNAELRSLGIRPWHILDWTSDELKDKKWVTVDEDGRCDAWYNEPIMGTGADHRWVLSSECSYRVGYFGPCPEWRTVKIKRPEGV